MCHVEGRSGRDILIFRTRPPTAASHDCGFCPSGHSITQSSMCFAKEQWMIAPIPTGRPEDALIFEVTNHSSLRSRSSCFFRRPIWCRAVTRDLLRQATPMLIKGRAQKIVLPEMGMLQINLSPTERAVYLLFLNHPEGIRLAEMGDYKAELRGILNQVSPSDSREMIEGQLEKLCEYNSNSLSEKMSRIKRKFDEKLGSAMSEHYYIKGPNGGLKKIHLDRAFLSQEAN